MQYTITEQGIHYMIEDNEADRQEAEQARAGYALSAIVEAPSIPDAEALATCQREAEKMREALKKATG